MERFKTLFEESKINLAKTEMLFRFLSPNSSVELFEEHVRLEQIQYELYSEMFGELVHSGLVHEFYDQMVTILNGMSGLEFSIFESKRLIEEMKAA